jgi:hypothetical protein
LIADGQVLAADVPRPDEEAAQPQPLSHGSRVACAPADGDPVKRSLGVGVHRVRASEVRHDSVAVPKPPHPGWLRTLKKSTPSHRARRQTVDSLDIDTTLQLLNTLPRIAFGLRAHVTSRLALSCSCIVCRRCLRCVRRASLPFDRSSFGIA